MVSFEETVETEPRRRPADLNDVDLNDPTRSVKGSCRPLGGGELEYRLYAESDMVRYGSRKTGVYDESRSSQNDRFLTVG